MYRARFSPNTEGTTLTRATLIWLAQLEAKGRTVKVKNIGLQEHNTIFLKS